MSVDPSVIQQAADLLWEADASHTPISPVRELLGTSTDIDAGYAVQELNYDRALAAGRRVSGRKIGVTSKAVQQQIGVDQPDFGTLFADTEYGDGVEIPASRLIQPRAEAEVALVIGRELDSAPHGFAEIIRSVEFALPAIEVVDSRIADWQISIVDTVADNASCGLYVVGSRPVPLSDFDIRTVPMSMTINGDEVSTGVGAACLGNPIHAARWLADVLCERGIPLQPGDVLMTGALGPMQAIGAGDLVVASFGDLGMVTTRLADE
jgi:2-keto-4-pentenoate hydratase